MPEETGRQQRKKAALILMMGNMHDFTFLIENYHLTVSGQIGPNRTHPQSKRTRPPGAKLGGCGVASPTPPSTSLVFVTIIMGVHDVPTDAIQTQGFEAASGWPVPNCLSTERV